MKEKEAYEASDRVVAEQRSEANALASSTMYEEWGTACLLRKILNLNRILN